MVTLPQMAPKTAAADGLPHKSPTRETDDRTFSFGEILKLKELELQKEQETSAATLSAMLAALQAASASIPATTPNAAPAADTVSAAGKTLTQAPLPAGLSGTLTAALPIQVSNGLRESGGARNTADLLADPLPATNNLPQPGNTAATPGLNLSAVTIAAPAPENPAIPAGIPQAQNPPKTGRVSIQPVAENPQAAKQSASADSTAQARETGSSQSVAAGIPQAQNPPKTGRVSIQPVAENPQAAEKSVIAGSPAAEIAQTAPAAEGEPSIERLTAVDVPEADKTAAPGKPEAQVQTPGAVAQIRMEARGENPAPAPRPVVDNSQGAPEAAIRNPAPTGEMIAAAESQGSGDQTAEAADRGVARVFTADETSAPVPERRDVTRLEKTAVEVKTPQAPASPVAAAATSPAKTAEASAAVQPEKRAEKSSETGKEPGIQPPASSPVPEASPLKAAVKPSAAPVNAQAADVVRQIMQQLHGKLQGGPNSMRLQLNPKELGEIAVEMVSSGQGVSVTFFAEQPGTGRMLETQMQQLRQSLTDSGVQLTNLNLSQQRHPGQEGGFTDRQPQTAQAPQPEKAPARLKAEAGPRVGTSVARGDGIDYLI